MYCYQCGTKLPEGAAFCQNCGAAQPGAGVPGAGTPAASTGKPASTKKVTRTVLTVLGILVGVFCALCLLILLISGHPFRFGNHIITVYAPAFLQEAAAAFSGEKTEELDCYELSIRIPKGMKKISEDTFISAYTAFSRESRKLEITGTRYDYISAGTSRGTQTPQELAKSWSSVASLQNIKVLELDGKPYGCVYGEKSLISGERDYIYQIVFETDEALWEIEITSHGEEYPGWEEIADSIRLK